MFEGNSTDTRVGGRAVVGLVCVDPGVRTAISASRNLCDKSLSYIFISNLQL